MKSFNPLRVRQETWTKVQRQAFCVELYPCLLSLLQEWCHSDSMWPKPLSFLFLLLIFFFCKDVFFISCVWTFCLCVCTCTSCMPGACGSQRRVLAPLKLEFLTVIIHHVDAGNWTRSFTRASLSPCSWFSYLPINCKDRQLDTCSRRHGARRTFQRLVHHHFSLNYFGKWTIEPKYYQKTCPTPSLWEKQWTYPPNREAEGRVKKAGQRQREGSKHTVRFTLHY